MIVSARRVLSDLCVSIHALRKKCDYVKRLARVTAISGNLYDADTGNPPSSE